jgi:hypothetical protein
MGRRMDVEPDDVADLGGEGWIVGEFEGADAVRCQSVCAPDALHRGQADPGGFGHRPAGPVGSLTRRLGQRQRHHARRHLRPQRRDAGRPRLVAQQPRDALLHESLLPAPHRRLALRRAAHDLVGAEAIGGCQYDVGSPHVLLRAVAVRHDRSQLVTISGRQCDADPCAHRADSHRPQPRGIPPGIPLSGSIH